MTPAEKILKRVAREIIARRLQAGTSARGELPVLLMEMHNRLDVRMEAAHRALKLAMPKVDWDSAARQCGLAWECGVEEVPPLG